MRLPFLFRRFLTVLLALIVFGAALLWAIPRWVSLDDQLDRLLAHLNRAYPGEIAARSMELKFTPWVGFRIHGAEIRSRAGSQIILPQLDIRLDPWKFLIPCKCHGNYSVVIPSATIESKNQVFDFLHILSIFQENDEHKTRLPEKTMNFQTNAPERNPDMPPPPSSLAKKPESKKPIFLDKLHLNKIRIDQAQFDIRSQSQKYSISTKNLSARIIQDRILLKGYVDTLRSSAKPPIPECGISYEGQLEFTLEPMPEQWMIDLRSERSRFNGFVYRNGQIDIVDDRNQGWKGSVSAPNCIQNK